MRTFGKQDGGQRVGLIDRGRGPYYWGMVGPV